MIYNLSDEVQKKSAIKRFKWFLDKGKKVELKEKRKARSNPQNRYLHLIFQWYGLELGYTLEEVKQDIFKRHICKDIFGLDKNGLTVFRSTKDLDSNEMTIAIETFRNHSSKDLGIYLPAPNELENIESIEQQLKSYGNRQYL